MDHACINGSRNRTVYFVCIQKSVKDLAAGADIPSYMIDVRKSRIADMMINAHRLFCPVKIFVRHSQTVPRAYVAGYKEIKLSVSVCLCTDIADSVNMRKDRLGMIQIYPDINFREMLCHIKI